MCKCVSVGENLPWIVCWFRGAPHQISEASVLIWMEDLTEMGCLSKVLLGLSTIVVTSGVGVSLLVRTYFRGMYSKLSSTWRKHMCRLACVTMKVEAAIHPKSCRQVHIDTHRLSETTDMREVIAVN